MRLLHIVCNRRWSECNQNGAPCVPMICGGMPSVGAGVDAMVDVRCLLPSD
jgi:hypothetical protein